MAAPAKPPIADRKGGVSTVRNLVRGGRATQDWRSRRKRAVQVIVFEAWIQCSNLFSRRGPIELTRSAPKRLYLIPVLSKALDILELLQNEQGPLALEAIYQRTNISKTTVYRILKTFVHRGYLAQSQDGLYRLMTRPRKARFGFGRRIRRKCLFPRR